MSIYDLRSVGVQGDERSYVYPAEITLYKKGAFVWDPDFMERVSLRIANEVRNVNRIVYVIANNREL